MEFKLKKFIDKIINNARIYNYEYTRYEHENLRIKWFPCGPVMDIDNPLNPIDTGMIINKDDQKGITELFESKCCVCYNSKIITFIACGSCFNVVCFDCKLNIDKCPHCRNRKYGLEIQINHKGDTYGLQIKYVCDYKWAFKSVLKYIIIETMDYFLNKKYMNRDIIEHLLNKIDDIINEELIENIHFFYKHSMNIRIYHRDDHDELLCKIKLKYIQNKLFNHLYDCDFIEMNDPDCGYDSDFYEL